MRLTFLRLAIVIVPGLVALGAAPAAAPSLGHAEAVHVLNRLTFGATTRSVTQLRGVGLPAWLRAQLHPGEVPDPRLDARLAAMTTLSLSPREIAEQFYLPALDRRRAARAAAGTRRTRRMARHRQGRRWHDGVAPVRAGWRPSESCSSS